MIYELKEYSFGETIGKGFNLYFNNFIQIFLISILCQIPLMLIMRFNNWLNPARLAIGSYNFIQIGMLALVNITIQSILAACVIYLISKKFLDDSSTPLNQKSVSIMRLIIPVAGLSIVVGFLTILGLLALVFPGIIIALGYSVAANVLVVEGKDIRKSMRRSWDLTKGQKGQILGLFIVAGIITACIQQPLLYVLKLLLKNSEWAPYLQLFISALIEPINACILVVIYFNLRIKKEGFNIEHLTRQFSLADYGTVVESK